MTAKKEKNLISIPVYVRDIARDVSDGLYQADPEFLTPDNVGIIVSSIIKADILERYEDILDGEKLFIKENKIKTKVFDPHRRIFNQTII